MIHLKLSTALTAVMLAIAGLPVLTACGDAPPSEEVAATGRLSAALLTIGSDGSTYRFPPGTRLALNGPNFSDEVPLDGNETLLNLTLPVGTYNLFVTLPGTSQLERTEDGVTSLIPATWTDAQPVTVAITENATTSVTLHYQVEALGDIVFSMGQLAVALQVVENAANLPAEVFENGTYTNAVTILGPSASAEAQAQLGMVAGESHPHFFDVNVTGSWSQFSLETVCASALFDAFTTGDGESGFSRAVRQLTSTTGLVCVENEGASDELFFRIDRLGVAPPDQQSYLPGTNYNFFLIVSGFVGDVYDGTTFSQSDLETPTPFTTGTIQHQIWDFSINQEVLFSHGTLTGTFQLVP